MQFKIHRGTKEIGGSCVEIWTKKTRILVDFGLPLVDKDGTDFDFRKYKDLSAQELVNEGILPNISGLYGNSKSSIEAVIISHAHQDHFGLINYINKNVKFYLGEATNKIIELNNIFTSQKINLKNTEYFENEKTFTIGDINITPYWVDHSAFDSYSFLIEANGKKIFYSGDFRSHGRKVKVFYRFLHNTPKNVDYLLLEGTTIGRENKPFKTENQIENELAKVFRTSDKINLIYVSGQNIDRLTSIYKACKRTGKTLVVDVYVAKVLKELSAFAKIPYPSDNFKEIKVMFPYYTSKKLSGEKNEQILFQFKKFKITKKVISENHKDIVMLVRPSMRKDLEKIEGIDGGNLIYSMWEGYLEKSATKKFICYLIIDRKFSLLKIHTSGHADIETLKKLVDAIKPKNIVPIHTFESDKYKNLFKGNVLELKDGEVRAIQ